MSKKDLRLIEIESIEITGTSARANDRNQTIAATFQVDSTQRRTMLSPHRDERRNSSKPVIIKTVATSLENAQRADVLFGTADMISITADKLSFQLPSQTAVIFDLN